MIRVDPVRLFKPAFCDAKAIDLWDEVATIYRHCIALWVTYEGNEDQRNQKTVWKTQRTPYVEVSEVYFYINNFILAYLGLKGISHTKIYNCRSSIESTVTYWACAACT